MGFTTADPFVRKYRYQNGERVVLRNHEALTARLNSEIPLELFKELTRMARKSGETKNEVLRQMIAHCVGDLRSAEKAIAPF